MRRPMPRSLWVPFAAAAVAGIVLVAFALASLRGYQRAADATLDAAQVYVSVSGIYVNLQQADLERRAYLLTEDEQFREAYDQSLATIPQSIEGLRQLVGENEVEGPLVDEMTELIDQRIALMDESIELHASGEAGDAAGFIAAGEGSALVDEIAQRMVGIIQEEAIQHEAARDRADRRATEAFIAISAAAVLLVGLLVWLFWALRRRGVEDALRRANHAKDEFLGMVSHELGTPIAIIAGNARLLRRIAGTMPAEDRDSALLDIQAESERLQWIVENMLQLSRNETTGADTLEPTLLQRAVERSVVRHRELNPGRTVNIEADPDLPVVLANAAYVDQVLQNLLSNATKYGDEDTPIDVAAHREGGLVHVSVMDRGPGIDPANRERIFMAFERLQSAAARREGLGLGLAVCRRLMQAQGGTITVDERAGGGSVFTFTLNVAPEATADNRDAIADGAPASNIS